MPRNGKYIQEVQMYLLPDKECGLHDINQMNMVHIT